MLYLLQFRHKDAVRLTLGALDGAGNTANNLTLAWAIDTDVRRGPWGGLAGGCVWHCCPRVGVGWRAAVCGIVVHGSGWAGGRLCVALLSTGSCRAPLVVLTVPLQLPAPGSNNRVARVVLFHHK